MKFSPYSFSRINTFEQCPKKFEFSYIKKINLFEPNLATERGSYIHTLLENYVKEKPTSFKFNLITDEIKQECDGVFEKFKNSEVGKSFLVQGSQAEVHFGVKRGERGLITCSYYDKEAIFRGKIDHLYLDGDKAIVADWKTGKISSFPAPLQLVMYAAWLFLKYPEIKIVESSFVYVEHPENPDCVKNYTFFRKFMKAINMKTIEKIANIEKAEKFPKKEGKLCEYCAYRKQGYCEESSQEEIVDLLGGFKYEPKKKEKLYYFVHPESGSAWIQDYIDYDEMDGLVEEIDETMFYKLVESFGYDERDINYNILRREDGKNS